MVVFVPYCSCSPTLHWLQRIGYRSFQQAAGKIFISAWFINTLFSYTKLHDNILPSHILSSLHGLCVHPTPTYPTPIQRALDMLYISPVSDPYPLRIHRLALMGIGFSMRLVLHFALEVKYSQTSKQRTLWEPYKFSCFVPYREVVLFSEVLNE